MEIKVLGSAAGGGFPQWNCGCPNCSAVRTGSFQGKARSQAQIAVRGDSSSWFLLGASPDLRLQIENTPELHPLPGVRQSPVAGVVLTSADLDHVLGLLLLREFQPIRVFAAESIIRILREDNSFMRMMNRVPTQVQWCPTPQRAAFELDGVGNTSSGILATQLPLGKRYPAYVSDERALQLLPEEASSGLLLEHRGKRLGYFPAVGQVDDELMKTLSKLDLLLFDGTFWDEEELSRVESSGPTAQHMGHIPVGGPQGSLERLTALDIRNKVFIHVNNTNPMLNEAGPEYRQIREAGWSVAEDGWQFTL
jgi:pyrroloquinoline quinone biosynthesis protein B